MRPMPDQPQPSVLHEDGSISDQSGTEKDDGTNDISQVSNMTSDDDSSATSPRLELDKEKVVEAVIEEAVVPESVNVVPLTEFERIRLSVQNFYKKYNPEKLSTIDTILQQYKGFEIQLVVHLIQKYNAVDESDLDIFRESMSVKDLLEIAGHQAQLKKENVVNGTTNSAENNTDIDKDDIKSPTKVQQLKELQKALMNGSIGTSKNSMISSNIQDMSSNFAGRFLNGWSSTTSGSMPITPSTLPAAFQTTKKDSSSAANLSAAPSSSSVADELLLSTRIKSLEAELLSLEASKTHLNGNIRSLKAQVLCCQCAVISIEC